MNRRSFLFPIQKLLSLALAVLFLMASLPEFSEAVSPERILQRSYIDDLEQGPVVMEMKMDSENNAENKHAELRIYYYNSHTKMFTFTKPENLKSSYYLVNNFNTWILTANMAQPVRISAQQKLFGEAGIAEASGIDYIHDYKIDKMTQDNTYYQLDLTGANKNITYKKLKIYIRKTDNRMEKVVLYTVSGIATKEIRYYDLQVINNFRIPNFEVINLLQQTGNKTRITVKNVTKRNLPLEAFNFRHMKRFQEWIKE